jgi:hypothetical protein
MPMAAWNLIFKIGSVQSPAGTGHFINITKIPILHDVGNPVAPVTGLLLVRLPHGAIAIHRHFPSIPEVFGHDLHSRKVLLTPENYALFKLPEIDWPLIFVEQRAVLPVDELSTGIPKVEIELTVRPENECMDARVVLRSSNAFEQNFLGIGLIIAIGMALLPITQMPNGALISGP